MLSQETFKVGIKMLEACYGLKPEQDTQRIWYRLLLSEDDKAFKNAVTELCRENAKLYPNDNIVAIIIERIKQDKEREYALRLKQEQEASVADTKNYVRLQYQKQLNSEIDKINRRLIGYGK